ncbi:unnamed protein product [Sympodiomycopsis kandeliae]
MAPPRASMDASFPQVKADNTADAAGDAKPNPRRQSLDVFRDQANGFVKKFRNRGHKKQQQGQEGSATAGAPSGAGGDENPDCSAAKKQQVSPIKQVVATPTTPNENKTNLKTLFFGKANAKDAPTGTGPVLKPGDVGPAPTPHGLPALGNNVIFFSPDQDMAKIQERLNEIYAQQKSNQFGNERYSLFFAPGRYVLDVNLGYYTTAHGLGQSPEDTVIEGAVRSKAALPDNNATTNFWRGAENLTVVPTIQEDQEKFTWATSQACWLRRMNVDGDAALSDHGGWSSGGYISDSKISGQVDNGTQQQYFMRNTELGSVIGGSYAQVFVGCPGAPQENWPTVPYSTIDKTPVIREKPYFIIDTDPKHRHHHDDRDSNGAKDPSRPGDPEDTNGDDGCDNGGDDDLDQEASVFGRHNHRTHPLAIVVPALRKKSCGPSWWGQDQPSAKDQVIPLSKWYIVQPQTADADKINNALSVGRNVLFTPGIYNFSRAIEVTRPDTVLLGLGLPTIKPLTGTPAITVDDIDGVVVSGFLLDAGSVTSSALLRVGDAKSSKSHAENPIVVHDIFCRVGGVKDEPTSTHTMITINAADTIVDHTWCWRADHDAGVGWTVNRCNTGFLVESDDVTAYGLFVEHCHEYQTLWNGERGRVYFYQSELPYDPPDVKTWSHSGISGYASYKVSPSVDYHFAIGLGIYCVFPSAPIMAHSAIEQPIKVDWKNSPTVLIKHVGMARFGGDQGSGIEHVINDVGGQVDKDTQRVFLNTAYD